MAAPESDPIRAEPISQFLLGSSSDWTYAVGEKGHAWLAYYDAGRVLHLRDPSGKERPLVPEDRAQAPSGLGMTAIGENEVAVLWRDKLPQKGLYLWDSGARGNPLELGGDSEPLARIQALTTANDLVHVLWYGEKGMGRDSPYNLYYRNWNLKTRDLSPLESVMDGIYPVMASDPAGAIMVFSWVREGAVPFIAARYRSADAGARTASDSFGPMVKIADVPAMAPIFRSFRVGSRWFAVWLAQRGDDRRDFRLEGARSDDSGKTWELFSVDSLRGYDIGALQVATDESGHIALAVSARSRSKSDSTRPDVYLIRSADAGTTWSAAERLRAPGAGDSDLSRFKAENPAVAFGPNPGEFLVVWSDWRNIRGELYASFSEDFGKTWQISNVPLHSLDGVDVQLDYAVNGAYSDKDGFKVIARQSTDHAMTSQKLVRLAFGAKDLRARSEQAKSQRRAPADLEKALKVRSEELWKALIEGDYTKAYDYQDPYFRAKMPRAEYVGLMGKIKYTVAETQSVKVDGPEGLVATKIRASVPPFRVPTTGEMISQPEREVVAPAKWLWVDGNWYREFREESRGLQYTQY